MLNVAVSVIIPSKNRLNLLSEALESVSSQTFRDFEVIVVNDGGADPSGEAAKYAKSFPLKLINKSIPKGCAAARNEGIKASEGTYIAYLDDDDLWVGSHIENLFSILEVNKEAGVAYSDCEIQKVDVNCRIVESKRLGVDFNLQQMLENDFIPPSSIMHRRKCLENAGLFDEGMGYSEDWDFLLRFAKLFKFVRIPLVSSIIRIREDGSNSSSNVNPERIRCLKLLQERYDTPELDVKTFWEVACHYEKKV